MTKPIAIMQRSYIEAPIEVAKFRTLADAMDWLALPFAKWLRNERRARLWIHDRRAPSHR